ncbi:hypothetical protein, partial [Klebsiella pneumoniae]
MGAPAFRWWDRCLVPAGFGGQAQIGNVDLVKQLNSAAV